LSFFEYSSIRILESYVVVCEYKLLCDMEDRTKDFLVQAYQRRGVVVYVVIVIVYVVWCVLFSLFCLFDWYCTSTVYGSWLTTGTR